jgi:hypothetical protein
LGVTASAALDLPTGATVVCAFGLTLLAFWPLTRFRRVREVDERSVRHSA